VSGAGASTLPSLTGRATLALALALAAGPVTADASGDAAAGRLRVVPTEIESSKGNLVVQLSASAEDFENDTEGFRYQIVPIRERRADIVFDDVPYGEYAIKIFHDENANEKLDTNLVGMPKERFGFSNDAMGRFGPPSFEQARFVFGQEQATIQIRIRGLR